MCSASAQPSGLELVFCSVSQLLLRFSQQRDTLQAHAAQSVRELAVALRPLSSVEARSVVYALEAATSGESKSPEGELEGRRRVDEYHRLVKKEPWTCPPELSFLEARRKTLLYVVLECPQTCKLHCTVLPCAK
jgi:hypothetical protein